MRGLRTWFSTSCSSPRTETLGWFVSIGRKPNTFEETSLRSFTELQSLVWGSFRSSTWASSVSVGSVSAVAGGRVQQCSLWPVPFSSLSWWPVFYLSSSWVRSICKPLFIIYNKSWDFPSVLYGIGLQCFLSFILHGNLLLNKCLFYGKLWYSVFFCIFS